MIDTTAIYILMGVFILLMFLGVHIVYALAISSILTTLYLGLPLQLLVQNMINQLNSFALLAVPFFILAGNIMAVGGITDRLVKFANSIIGWLRGGLAQVNIMASMFFGGISGSAAADTASIGSIMIPTMKKNGYDGEFSTSITMASSVQGLLIPPSHNMVLFAIAAGGVSVGRLFLGGLVPGILLGVALMIFSYIVSIKKKYPKGDRFNFKVLLRELYNSIFGLGTVLIVVVGVITGIFTPTESAAIACVYAFIIAFFVYKEAPISAMGKVLIDTLKTLSIVLIIACAASAFGWLIAYLHVPAFLLEILTSISSNKIVILLLINLFLLFLGTFMNMVSSILIVTPILLPVVVDLGMDPVHFGVVLILNLGIGLITPPVGTLLFIGSSISKLSVEQLTKSMLPFYTVMIIVLLIVTFIPEFSMIIPDLIMPVE